MSFKRQLPLLFAVLVLFTSSVAALDVKVMSYNIRYGTADDGEHAWHNRCDLLIDQLRRHDADVIGMQEALRFQIDEILEALPHYDKIGIGRDGGEWGEYSCILYNTRRFDVVESGTFWLSKTPEKRSRDWDSACVRICTWALLSDKKNDEQFYHYNTHLDHASAEARLNGVRLIVRRISTRTPGLPFVLTGDFNAGEKSPPLRRLKKGRLPMVDTFRVLHPAARDVGTFNRFRGDRSGAKIDYILTAPDTTVLEAGIVFSMPNGRCISDHFPVTATVRF